MATDKPRTRNYRARVEECPGQSKPWEVLVATSKCRDMALRYEGRAGERQGR